jgi:hypothetical protein
MELEFRQRVNRQYQPPEEQRNAIPDVKFWALKTGSIQVPVYVIKVMSQCLQKYAQANGCLDNRFTILDLQKELCSRWKEPLICRSVLDHLAKIG